MKTSKFLCTLLLAAALQLPLAPADAQEAPSYPELGAKLDEYFSALSGLGADIQSQECDFIISSCTDSLVRQFVALRIYDHYLSSPIMGDDAVAVHVAKEWFLSGKVPMASELDEMNAKVYVTFNEQSLIGNPAPEMTLCTPSGAELSVPADGGYAILYFYDTGCSSCRLETASLATFLRRGEYPVVCYAVYTGTDPVQWEKYRTVHLDLPSVVNVWDPDGSSDFQLKYGVLKTPWMVLVGPDGRIVGRGLDTRALSILLATETGAAEDYVYGDDSRMKSLDRIFATLGDSLSAEAIVGVADYLAARTLGEGDADSYKEFEGDLLYYLESRTGEVFKDGELLFIDKFILGTDIWDTPRDTALVVSLAAAKKELLMRTPVGSEVPDIKVPGTLLRKKGLFCKGRREGTFSLRGSKADYLVFYSRGCSRCDSALRSIEAMTASSAGGKKVRALLIDMDSVLESDPSAGAALLDSFDLSVLPHVLELSRAGTVLHRYVNL